MEGGKLFCLLLCLFVTGSVGVSMEDELAKLEGELEKLELAKAKRELKNNIKDYLSSEKSDSAKKAVELKENKAGASVDDAKVTKESFDGLVKDLEAKQAKREAAETHLHAILGNILDNIEKKRSSSAKPKCEDRRDDCNLLKEMKFCTSEKYKEIMEKECALTCEHCSICVNSIPDQQCASLKKMGMCGMHRRRMENLCYKACGYCQIPLPPACANTALGCCWDKVVAKVDKQGSNCRPCKDSYKYLCRTFSDDCLKGNSAGDFMRKYCPGSCKICSGGSDCEDDPTQGQFCPAWKRNGLCSSEQETMKVFCKKTCGLC